MLLGFEATILDEAHLLQLCYSALEGVRLAHGIQLTLTALASHSWLAAFTLLGILLVPISVYVGRWLKRGLLAFRHLLLLHAKVFARDRAVHVY